MTGQQHADPRLTAALRYAQAAWPVFPCIGGEKAPATKHGFPDATTDPDKIIWWWSRNPDRNVAIATGAPGPDVLDVDVHKQGNGFAAFNRLHREGLLGGASAYIRTPSGGLHAYFAGSEHGNGRLPHHHLDFRSKGGYVVAPPSHINGRHYELISRADRHGGLDWTAVTRLLEPQPQPRPQRSDDRSTDAHRLAEWVASQQEGNRNGGLFWAANRALEAGLTDLGELTDAARRAGLREREIARTLASAYRHADRPVHAKPLADHNGGTGQAAARGGTVMTLVSAVLVRAYVLKLRAAGGTYQSIGCAAGTGAMTVHCIANARRPKVHATIASRLLAISEADIRTLRPSPGGIMWRLRALVAMGHTCTRMATAIDIPPATLRRIVRGAAHTISPELQQAVITLFDAWWLKTPPQRTRREQLAAASALKRAALNDWPPPAGLDEDELDRPGYQPQCG